MTTVIAQGTFDLLHPGHVHYLTDAAARGDELHVIIARRENVTHKAKPILPDRQRRDMVAALDCVDEAHLGHPEDIFVPIEEIQPVSTAPSNARLLGKRSTRVNCCRPGASSTGFCRNAASSEAPSTRSVTDTHSVVSRLCLQTR